MSEQRIQTELPANIGRLARRALARAGIENLEQLSQYTEKEILALHGIGPKGLTRLREALSARGMSFMYRAEQ